MPSNRLTKRRYAISNPKICKSPPTPPKAPTPPPPPWPPPYLRATLKAQGNYEQLEFDLTLYPDIPAYPTTYYGYTQQSYAYAYITCTIGPTTSTFTPYSIAASGQYEYFSASYGSPVDIPNNAFQFLNDDWSEQHPSNAQIILIVAYP